MVSCIAGIATYTPPPQPRTVVCKLHEMTASVANEADVVVMSHRDPFGSICSRKLETTWCKNPYTGQCDNPCLCDVIA